MRFHWKPPIGRRDDPVLCDSRVFGNEFLLGFDVPDVLDDRVGDGQVVLLVPEGHVASIGDYKGPRLRASVDDVEGQHLIHLICQAALNGGLVCCSLHAGPAQQQ